jgi:TolA-binding protein
VPERDPIFDLGPRWTDGPLLGRSGEADALEILRAGTPLPSFSAVSQQRVWRRLQREPGRRWWRPAVVTGLVLAAGAAAASSVAVIRVLTRPAAPRLTTTTVVRRELATPVNPTASSPPVIRAADVPAKAKGVRVRSRRAHLVKTAAAKPVSIASSDDGALGKETTLFREALSLRAARDPRGALAALERYTKLYPRGSYAAEVVVLRGELAADAGDCAAATIDFNRTLAAPGSPGLEERALYGRAACRQRAGDRPAARADFERYLERFPRGKFAAHARAALR